MGKYNGVCLKSISTTTLIVSHPIYDVKSKNLLLVAFWVESKKNIFYYRNIQQKTYIGGIKEQMYTGEMMQDEFALKLTSLRKEKGWTQEELAEKCGISRQAVAKWEGGKSLPDIFRIVELADLFQVDVADILPDTESNLNLKYCIEAVGDIFASAIIVNLTKNEFDYVRNEDIFGNIVEPRGSYEELYDKAQRSVPDANQRLNFIKLFKRDALLKTAESGEKVVSLDHRIKDANGTPHWVQTTACFVREANRTDVVAIFFIRVIDAEKDREEKSEREIIERQSIINVLSNEYDAVFLSNLDTGAVLYSYSENVADVSQEAVEMMEGFSNCFSDELSEMHKLLIHPDDIESFKKSISKQYVTDMLRKHESFVCNYRMLLGDQMKHYQTRFVRALDFETSNNFIAGIHCVEPYYKDIERQQKELESTIDTIRSNQDERDNLIIQLSHDIRTPLNSIMGFLNLAKDSSKGEDKDYYLRMATEACENMTLVLNNVIDLVSPKGDNVIIKKQDWAIKKLLNQVISSTNDMAKKVGLDSIGKKEEPEESKPSRTKLEGKRILLVEDTEANAMVTGAFLKDWGVEMMRAHDGVEALEMMEKSPLKGFDLVLMDIQMPEMDGYEATKRIRKLPNKTCSKVPIIALTASVFDSEKEEALNAGMNDHICKPFTPKQLYDKIVSYV